MNDVMKEQKIINLAGWKEKQHVDVREFWYIYLSMVNISRRSLTDSELIFLSILLSKDSSKNYFKRKPRQEMIKEIGLKNSRMTYLKNSLISKKYLTKDGYAVPPLRKLQRSIEDGDMESVVFIHPLIINTDGISETNN